MVSLEHVDEGAEVTKDLLTNELEERLRARRDRLESARRNPESDIGRARSRLRATEQAYYDRFLKWPGKYDPWDSEFFDKKREDHFR